MDRIERALDRFTERHEALTQSVELLKGLHEAQESRTSTIEALLHTAAGQISESAEHINTLARIAASHDRRLKGLEGGR
jgi:hypothetical protein